ncbi:hypothetical protein LBR04_05630 [Levilactobacillus brevis]|nr:hypothetical protein LBR04_05630 [Levilactobacillus brevis]
MSRPEGGQSQPKVIDTGTLTNMATSYYVPAHLPRLAGGQSQQKVTDLVTLNQKNENQKRTLPDLGKVPRFTIN